MRWLLFFVCLILVLCTNAQNGSKQFVESKCVVLKWDKSYNWIFSSVKSSTLTDSEIKQVQDLLKRAVLDHNEKTKFVAEKIPSNKSYYIQLLPVINGKGQKEVWINCFCSVDGNKWKNEICLVKDGGNFFFNLKINLTLKTFYAFMVNGYA